MDLKKTAAKQRWLECSWNVILLFLTRARECNLSWVETRSAKTHNLRNSDRLMSQTIPEVSGGYWAWSKRFFLIVISECSINTILMNWMLSNELLNPTLNCCCCSALINDAYGKFPFISSGRLSVKSSDPYRASLSLSLSLSFSHIHRFIIMRSLETLGGEQEPFFSLKLSCADGTEVLLLLLL